METTVSLVIIEIILDELWLFTGDAVRQPRDTGSDCTTLRVTGTDNIHHLPFFVAVVGTILCVKITIGIHTAHIVHRRSHCSLDTCIHSSSI